VTKQVLRDWPHKCLSWWCPYPQYNELQTRSVFWPPSSPRIFPRTRLRRFKTRMVEICWVPLAKSHLRRTIARVSPDVIWCIPHEWSIPVANTTLPHQSVPYAVYLQDYPTTDQVKAVVGARTANRWMNSVDDMIRHAQFFDATSYPMADDIARRTGRFSTQMLHEGLEQEDFQRLSELTFRRSDERFTVAFAGTIVAEEAFEKTIKNLDSSRSTFGKQLHLRFYSSHKYTTRSWFNSTWMSEHGYKDRSTLIKSLQECQAGFVVMDEYNINANYNRFSFPTKFITYIAAGIEPLVVGHESSAVAVLVRQSGVGRHFSNVESLIATMPNLLNREAADNSFTREKVMAFAHCHFDADAKREIFRSGIAAIAN
jgi:hypothetical protein